MVLVPGTLTVWEGSGTELGSVEIPVLVGSSGIPADGPGVGSDALVVAVVVMPSLLTGLSGVQAANRPTVKQGKQQEREDFFHRTSPSIDRLSLSF
jgi:hypothetical protein